MTKSLEVLKMLMHHYHSLLSSSKTSYNGAYDKSPLAPGRKNPSIRSVREILNVALLEKTYQDAFSKPPACLYADISSRITFNLGKSKNSHLPTNERD
jgi:hypothetical protein